MTPIIEPCRYTTFPSEQDVLTQLLVNAPGSVAIEIGAHEGLTTRVLAPFALDAGVEYIVIDPWDGTQDSAGDDCYGIFIQNTQHLDVGIWRMRSHDATPPADLGFVFHDGDHRNPDFQKWWDALIPGGVLVVHDVTEGAGWPAVRAGVDALGLPCHEYRYRATPEEALTYGPSTRGLWWKVKP